MPAALAAIALIVVSAIWLADGTQWARLRGDALASLAYVANWRFIAAGDRYGAAFSSPSPFTHFWTLSIEEQFYIFAPLILVAILVATRGNRRWVGGAIIGLIAGSVLWSNWLVHSGATVDRLYFGTDVRMAELFAGVLLALWWTRRPDPIDDRARRVSEVAGPVALVVMIGLWATADLDDLIFYRGGLLAYSLLTLALIVAAMQPGGFVTRALSLRPLVWVGMVSYAAYLLHYPILIWLRQHTGLDTWLRLAVAVALTFTVAAISGRYLERPIRNGAISGAGRAAGTCVAAVALVAALVVVTTALADPDDASDLDAAAERQRELELTPAQLSSSAPRVAFFGDSSALMTALGMQSVSRAHPESVVAVRGFAALGCGLTDSGARRVGDDHIDVPELCSDWPTRWERASLEEPADVAVVQLGPWEVADQQTRPDGPFRTIGQDPELDAEFEAELRAGIDVLLDHHGMVVLLLPPDVEFGRIDGRSPDTPADQSDPARMRRFREILEQVAADTDRVETLDLASWVGERSDDASLRPDGVHFTVETARTAAEWLGPQLVELFADTTGHITTQVDQG